MKTAFVTALAMALTLSPAVLCRGDEAAVEKAIASMKAKRGWVVRDADRLGNPVVSACFREIDVTDEDISVIAAFEEIESLTIANTKVQISDSTVKLIATLKTLKRLEIYEVNLAGISLDPLRELPKLEGLLLAGTSISDEDAGPIGKLEHLKLLNLACTKITDKCLEGIAKLAVLEELVLVGTGITDDGLILLSPLGHLKLVWVLDAKVTNQGARKLRHAIEGVQVRRSNRVLIERIVFGY